jgi:hypothetical protein
MTKAKKTVKRKAFSKPKIYYDKQGRRFIRISGKKVIIEKGITERELIKYIIKTLGKKPRRKRKVSIMINQLKGLHL